MVLDVLADVVVVVHVSFLLFVALGALLAWWWPRLVWLHVPALAWGLASITIGLDCPLTPLEKGLRRSAGKTPYEGGFVDHYLEDVLFPDEVTPVLRGIAAVLVVVGYGRLLRRRRAVRSVARTAG